MICHNNLLFSILYRGDVGRMRELVLGSLDRLGDRNWPRDLPWDQELLRASFILLLHKDLGLKEIVLTGVGPYGPLDPRKAEAFFLALGPEAIDPWLSDERRTKQDLIDSVKNLYLVS